MRLNCCLCSVRVLAAVPSPAPHVPLGRCPRPCTEQVPRSLHLPWGGADANGGSPLPALRRREGLSVLALGPLSIPVSPHGCSRGWACPLSSGSDLAISLLVPSRESDCFPAWREGFWERAAPFTQQGWLTCCDLPPGQKGCWVAFGPPWGSARSLGGSSVLASGGAAFFIPKRQAELSSHSCGYCNLRIQYLILVISGKGLWARAAGDIGGPVLSPAMWCIERIQGNQRSRRAQRRVSEQTRPCWQLMGVGRHASSAGGKGWRHGVTHGSGQHRAAF